MPADVRKVSDFPFRYFLIFEAVPRPVPTVRGIASHHSYRNCRKANFRMAAEPQNSTNCVSLVIKMRTAVLIYTTDKPYGLTGSVTVFFLVKPDLHSDLRINPNAS